MTQTVKPKSISDNVRRRRVSIATAGSAAILVIAGCAWFFRSSFSVESDHQRDTHPTEVQGSASGPYVNAQHEGLRTRLPPAISKQFGMSENLSVFVMHYADQAGNGDGEAARLIATAYEECKQLTAHPREYAEMLKAALGKALNTERSLAFDAAINREEQRCNGLISASTPAAKEVPRWYRSAAASGDLAAQIRLLRGSQDAVELADLENKLLASSDGAAMSEFGALLSQLTPEERQSVGGLSSQRLSNYAWSMAACEFGDDCSAAGEQLRTICLRAALCGFNRLEDAYRQLLSPIDFDSAWQLREEVIQTVRVTQ